MRTPAILQVTAYYPPHLGGQESAVQDLATELAATGARVEVVTSDLGARVGTDVINGVRVTRLKSAELARTPIIWGLPFWLLRHADRNTIVHVHVGQFLTSEIVWLASKIKGFKYVTHMHIDPVQSGPLGKLLPLYKKLFLGPDMKKSEAAIVLNREHAEIVRRDYGYKNKLFVMSNGVKDEFFNIERLPNKSGVLRLLYVGRLVPQKNLHTLLEALSRITSSVSLDIVGDGQCRSELEAIAEQRSLANVKFRGTLSRHDVMDFYATSDLLVLPSAYESQPIVLLEAMAARLPIVAADVIGIREAVAGVAILADPTVKGMTEAMESFISMSAPSRQLLADAGFSKVQSLRWNVLVNRYLDIYNGIPQE
jgi:glycosyltransferase involved in cell wall biosynthesis